jgi:hypothetical protein
MRHDALYLVDRRSERRPGRAGFATNAIASVWSPDTIAMATEQAWVAAGGDTRNQRGSGRHHIRHVESTSPALESFVRGWPGRSGGYTRDRTRLANEHVRCRSRHKPAWDDLDPVTAIARLRVAGTSELAAVEEISALRSEWTANSGRIVRADGE